MDFLREIWTEKQDQKFKKKYKKDKKRTERFMKDNKYKNVQKATNQLKY